MPQYRLHIRGASGYSGRSVPPSMGKLIQARWLLLFLAASSVAMADPSAPAPPAVLPQGFAGFHLSAPLVPQPGPAAAAADPEHSALLREDGLIDAAAATYTGAGPAITVQAWRFGDATGAYAAFTAYREPQMRREDLGIDGSSLGNHYLFWVGSTLVSASLTQPDQHPLTDLRALAAMIPRPHGPASVPPPVRGYLPTSGLDAESVHYSIGPAGYAASHAPLPESVIDFSRDAEAVTAHYHGRAGDGLLTLINYPTPQIAGARQKDIESLIKSGAPPLAVGDPALVAERIGPLVAFTSGSFTEAQAHALIRQVHLDEMITINHPEGYISEVSKAARLLLGIAEFTGIMAVAAVLLALFLGGGRVLVRRLRGKPASSMNDDDFISLKLS